MIDLSAKLDDLIALEDLPCALALNSRCRMWDEVDRLQPLSFGERGTIAIEFEERRLWQFIEGCHSFDSWMSTRPDACRATMYAAWRAARELRGDIDDLAEIPRETLNTLRELSSEVRRQPEVIDAAKTMKPNDFKEHIEVDHPNQHIEGAKAMKFNTSRSQFKAIDDVINYAINQKGAGSREQALEYMAAEAMHQWELEAELANMPLENDDDGVQVNSPTVH